MTRNLSTWLKGLAITLMVLHHAFGAPRYYVDGIAYPALAGWTGEIDRFAGFLVVPLFLFLTGWTYRHHEEKSFRYSLKKISSFLASYWIILGAFAFLAVHVCGYPLTLTGMVQEMFSISNDIMIFSWFVFLYLMVMTLLPLWARLTDGLSAKKTLLAFILFFGIIKGCGSVVEFIGMRESFLYVAVKEYGFRKMPVAFGGYLCARFGIVERIYGRFARWNVMKRALLMLICILFYDRVTNIGTISTGLFLVPVAIALIATFSIQYESLTGKGMLWLGRHSMNIWFLHCLFFAEATRQVFQHYAYWPGNPALVVGWILLLCGIVSVPLTGIQNIVTGWISRLLGYGSSGKVAEKPLAAAGAECE